MPVTTKLVRKIDFAENSGAGQVVIIAGLPP